MSGVSDSVLEALACALELEEAERAHLFDLARSLRPSTPPRRQRARKRPVRPSVQHMLDAITGAAAFVHNARLDNLATNELARALYSEMFTRGAGPVNSARYVFLDPGARDFYIDFAAGGVARPSVYSVEPLSEIELAGERAASDVVAILRAAAGRDPYDRELSDLVGELSTRSNEFRTRWAAHNVRFHDTGTKELHHATVGELTLTYNRVDLSADPGLALTIYTAEPGTRSAEALNLLGSWAATPQQPQLQEAPDGP